MTPIEKMRMMLMREFERSATPWFPDDVRALSMGVNALLDTLAAEEQGAQAATQTKCEGYQCRGRATHAAMEDHCFVFVCSACAEALEEDGYPVRELPSEEQGVVDGLEAWGEDGLAGFVPGGGEHRECKAWLTKLRELRGATDVSDVR